jgi:hypothetical protein
MALSDYPAWELQPRKLSPDEVQDPNVVISQLFDFMHLPQVRQALWDWFKLTVTGQYKNEKASEKANLIMLYEKLEKLIEAVHIIHKARTTSK